MQLLSQLTSLGFEVRKAAGVVVQNSYESKLKRSFSLKQLSLFYSLFLTLLLFDPEPVVFNGLEGLGTRQDVMNVCCALLWPDLPEEVAAQAFGRFGLFERVRVSDVKHLQ